MTVYGRSPNWLLIFLRSGPRREEFHLFTPLTLQLSQILFPSYRRRIPRSDTHTQTSAFANMVTAWENKESQQNSPVVGWYAAVGYYLLLPRLLSFIWSVYKTYSVRHLDQPQAGLVRVCRKESWLRRRARCFIKLFICQKTETERLRLCVFLVFLQEVIDNPASCCWCTWGPLSGILIRLFACSSRCCGKSGFDFGAAWGCRHHFSARFLSVGGGGVHYMILIAMRGDGDEWLNWYICFKSSKNSCPGFSFEISQINFFSLYLL